MRLSMRRTPSSTRVTPDSSRVMTDTATAHPHTLLAALARTSVRLELGTYDLCCLAGLHLRSEREGLTSVPDALCASLVVAGFLLEFGFEGRSDVV